jgi:2-polyprenyl-3-methyl-5-hydroxy-6-metoxy-1,4-benzoquinol methylase
MTTNSPRPALIENTSKNTHNVVADLLLNDDDVQRILDIPAGEGAFAQRCLDAGRSVVASDCENLCKVSGVPFEQGNMNEPLPFSDDAFDAVVCIDGIEHIERPFDFVGECRRVVRPGGAIVLSTPNISSLRSRWRWLTTGFHYKCQLPLDETDPNPLHHINMLSFPELRYMLHRADFEITAIAANRCKLVSYLYAPLAPISYLLTRWALASEKDAGQRERNQEILRQLNCWDLLFGETAIVMARNAKQAASRRQVGEAA